MYASYLLLGMTVLCFCTHHFWSFIEQKKALRKLIQFGGGLSLEDIAKLGPRSDTYIIPSRQLLSKPYGMVIYAVKGRKEGQEEALNMTLAFKQLGLNVLSECWENFETMKEKFSSTLEKIKGECNFLLVSLMSHGFEGHVKGDEGEPGEINELIREVELTLPSFVPVVSQINSQLYQTRLVPTPRSFSVP